ncbi:MAG TPA: hypothetical protein VE291_04225 [Terracidiphilus sp.]|nr:hypothetical protein [Terracidiphilus sp.]
MWLLLAGAISAQVLVIDTSGKVARPSQGANVDRRYAQIDPTHVDLPKAQLDAKTRYELLRFLEADQGFAMRPFPRGHKGLTLEANGKLEPAGEAYLDLVTSQGLSAKPGDRLVITDVKIEHGKITLMLNGGPDARHRFLRHVEVGGGVGIGPVVQDDGQEATGSRLTLAFKERIPELTGKQVEALLAPLISFEVKTPVQAYTDTLPPKLKAAILDHDVLVGMNTDMVLFAKGQPRSKIREMDGQMPFEEWIYGKPPEDVEFVRINGNRVIRLEVAKMGKTPVIFTKDEVEGLMRTDGTPVVAESNTHTVQVGDVQRDPETQAPAAPPSLRKPGETIPADDGKGARIGVEKPVQFPKQTPDDHPVAHQGDGAGAGAPATGGSEGTAAPAATAKPAPAPDASQSSTPATVPPQPPE